MNLKSIKTTNANIIQALEREYAIKLVFLEEEHDYICNIIGEDDYDDVLPPETQRVVVMTIEEYSDKTIRQKKLREFLLEDIYDEL